MTPLLQVQSLSKSFPGVRALDGVNLHIAGGEVLAVVGENGAGKSTLLGILSGTVSPDGGTIRLHGVPVAIASPARPKPIKVLFLRALEPTDTGGA